MLIICLTIQNLIKHYYTILYKKIQCIQDSSNRTSVSIFETIKSQQNKLEKAEKKLQYLKKELGNEQNMNFRIKYSRLVSEYELNEANKLLDRRIEPGELREIADEIYHNPSKHTDIISEIRERRDRSS